MLFTRLRFVFAATIACTCVAATKGIAQSDHVFHKGDKVLASPYAGTWQVCTLITDREGSPRFYNYTAMCDPVGGTASSPLQKRNFTEANVKALNDPVPSKQIAPPAAAPPPNAANAGQYKVGDRVAMPSGSGKWLDAVIISVDSKDPKFPYLVHPLGYTPYMDSHFNAGQLHARGTIATEPIGGIVDDPYLLAVQGNKAFKPMQLMPGVYECFTRTNGQLVSAAILNFSILDKTHFQSVTGGATAEYRFDPATGAVTFLGGGLNGQRGKYTQSANPPVRSQPPHVQLERSGDYCDLKMY